MKTKSRRKSVTKIQNNNNKTKRKQTKRKQNNLVTTKSSEKDCHIIGLKSFEDNIDKNQFNTKKSNELYKKQFAKQLVSYFSPKHIQPTNDYYSYVNYAWINNFTLENKLKYITEIDNFRLAQDKVFEELNTIILDYIRTHDNELSKELNAFYKSCNSYISVEYSKQVLKNILENIDEIRKNKNNVWKMLAWINSDEMISYNAPLTWKLLPDEKEPEIFRCFIQPFSFPILDYSIYYDDGTNVEYKKKYRNDFIKLVNTYFNESIPYDKTLNAQDVYDVHIELFNALGCISVTKNNKIYNKVFANESLSKYGFDWKEFSKELGFNSLPSFFITDNLNYLKCCSELLVKNWDSEKWRSYWYWIFVRRNFRLTNKWRQHYYNFFCKFQGGQEKILDIKSNKNVLISLFMSLPFNTFLTNEYINKFKDPRVSKYVEIMCEDLKKVFLRIVNRNTWLTPETKKNALLKLKHLKFQIGNSIILGEDKLLGYTTNLYDNFIKFYHWRHKYFISLEGEKVFDIPYIDWNHCPPKLSVSQAYVVNASYTPYKNAIDINLAYMQKPFVDLDERGIEYNLAHLGFIIGHEMSHSLDDSGSQYDYKGVLINWWNKEDSKKFKLIQKDIINQYEEWAAKDRVKFDVSIGIGEDLADISGLAICEEYLRDFQTFNDDLIPIRYLSYRAFYTYYTMQMRQQLGKKGLTVQLKSNVHPLDKYRTNVPLSRSSYFRSIYNVKKGDGMWWHNENTIW